MIAFAADLVLALSVFDLHNRYEIIVKIICRVVTPQFDEARTIFADAVLDCFVRAKVGSRSKSLHEVQPIRV
jgi:hypothetical protein